MKKPAGAVILAGMLTLLWPGWGLSREDPGNYQRAQLGQQKRLLQQKQQQLTAQMKLEFQQLRDAGYTPQQLEQWQREQHAKMLGELKRSALEKSR